MGFGDELMAAGEAKRARRTDPRKVVVLDKAGKPRWHALWDGNPDIARKAEKNTQSIVNGPGARPYVDYPAMMALGRRNGGAGSTKAILRAAGRWVFRDYEPVPADLPCIGPVLRRENWVLIEPHIKGNASPNKQWGWDRWQALVDDRPDIEWRQVGPRGTKTLNGVRLIETQSFIEACHYLEAARAAVLPEGGLHHAAAALGTPSVVIYGGFTSPRQTGYSLHRNLFTGGKPCGAYSACPHCAEAMSQITPEIVAGELDEIL